MANKKKYDYFGFKLFWELVQDDSKLPNNLLKPCLNSLGDLFACLPRIPRTEKDKYLTECFENLKNGQSVPQSLILSLHILASMQASSLYSKGNTRNFLNN